MKHPPHTFDDLAVGTTFDSPSRVITRADIDQFTRLSGDRTALHSDDDYARSTPLGGIVAHGALNLAAATGMAYELGIFEGTVLAVQSMTISFDRPVHSDDSLTLRLQVAAKADRPRPGRGRVEFDMKLLNQEDRCVMSGCWTILMRRPPATAPDSPPLDA
jgi:acyl dehydratase